MPLLLLALAVGIYYKKEDVSFLESYSYFILNPKISYELSQEGIDNIIKYEPNVRSYSGLSFSTENFSAALAYQNEEPENDTIDASTLFDLQLMGTFKNHLWEIYYQNYQDLFITDTQIFKNNYGRANSWSLGANMKHFTNDNYNIHNSMAYFSKNKKSDWSGVLGVNFNKSKLSSNDGLIPSEVSQGYDQLIGLEALEINSLGIDGGFSGLHIYKDFFFGALFTLGLQYQEQSFTGIDTSNRVVTSSTANAIIDMGYDFKNGSNLGIYARNFTSVIPVKDSEFKLNRSAFGVYFKHFF